MNPHSYYTRKVSALLFEVSDFALTPVACDLFVTGSGVLSESPKEDVIKTSSLNCSRYFYAGP